MYRAIPSSLPYRTLPPLVIPCLTSLHSTTPSPPLYNPLTCLPSPLHYIIPSSLPYPTLSFTLPYPALLHSTLPSPPFTLLHSTSLYSTISPHPISSAHYPILPCNHPSPTPLHSCHYTRLNPPLLFTLTYPPSHLQLHSTHVTTTHSTHPSPVPFPILPCALPYPTKLLFTLPYPAPLHSTTPPPRPPVYRTLACPTPFHSNIFSPPPSQSYHLPTVPYCAPLHSTLPTAPLLYQATYTTLAVRLSTLPSTLPFPILPCLTPLHSTPSYHTSPPLRFTLP